MTITQAADRPEAQHSCETFPWCDGTTHDPQENAPGAQLHNLPEVWCGWLSAQPMATLDSEEACLFVDADLPGVELTRIGIRAFQDDLRRMIAFLDEQAARLDELENLTASSEPPC